MTIPFIPGKGNSVHAIALQPDGKIVLAGHATSASGESDFSVVRVTASGQLDSTFGVDGKSTIPFVVSKNDEANAVALQPDGRIVLAGYAVNATGVEDFAIARLTASGQLDATFATSGIAMIPFVTGKNARANGITLLPDGKIIVAGYATNSNNLTDMAVARLTAAGQKDATFGAGGIASFPLQGGLNEAFSVALQSDGKIILSGYATDAALRPIFAAVRLNTSGQLDSNFGTGGTSTISFGTVKESVAKGLALQPDGKIVLAGYVEDASLSAHFAAARLTAAGQLDTTFGTSGTTTIPLTSDIDQAHSVALQPDGKIVLAGFAVTTGGTDFATARLTIAGQLDATFGVGGKTTIPFAPGRTDMAHAVALQQDGKIILAGLANNTAGGSDFAAARLMGDNQAPVILNQAFAIREKRPVGAVVGTVQASDSDSGQTLRFAITGGNTQDAFTIDPATGQITVKNHAALSIALHPTFALTITATDNGTPSLTSSATVTVTLQRMPSIYVTGADAGGGPDVKVYNADGSLRHSFFAFDQNFTGGVRVATGDVNGDGTADVVVGAGPGGGPNVKVFSGSDGVLLPGPIGNFFPYDKNFTGGVFVAAGDVNGDGFADVITAADAGGGPDVKVIDGKTGIPIYSFFTYDPNFGGGIRVASGDVNGDGRADIITGAGPGGGPDVKTYNGPDGKFITSFFAYTKKTTVDYTLGVYVGAADIDGDGKAEILVGKGPGEDPTMSIFLATGMRLYDRMPYDPAFRGGVRVAGVDRNGDGKADVLCVAGPGGGADVKIYDGVTINLIDQFFAYNPAFTGGIYVAASQ